MNNREAELTAYCGLYCGDCPRYRMKAADLARDLLDELEGVDFGKYAAVKSSAAEQFDAAGEFEHYDECREVLEGIVRLQCHETCRVGGGCRAFSCTIVACCRERGFEGCWECGTFEGCEKFAPLAAFHGDTPQQNLKKIREMGVAGWSEHRGKFYRWQ